MPKPTIDALVLKFKRAFQAAILQARESMVADPEGQLGDSLDSFVLQVAQVTLLIAFSEEERNELLDNIGDVSSEIDLYALVRPSLEGVRSEMDTELSLWLIDRDREFIARFREQHPEIDRKHPDNDQALIQEGEFIAQLRAERPEIEGNTDEEVIQDIDQRLFQGNVADQQLRDDHQIVLRFVSELFQYHSETWVSGIPTEEDEQNLFHEFQEQWERAAGMEPSQKVLMVGIAQEAIRRKRIELLYAALFTQMQGLSSALDVVSMRTKLVELFSDLVREAGMDISSWEETHHFIEGALTINQKYHGKMTEACKAELQAYLDRTIRIPLLKKSGERIQHRIGQLATALIGVRERLTEKASAVSMEDIPDAVNGLPRQFKEAVDQYTQAIRKLETYAEQEFRGPGAEEDPERIEKYRVVKNLSQKLKQSLSVYCTTCVGVLGSKDPSDQKQTKLEKALGNFRDVSQSHYDEARPTLEHQRFSPLVKGLVLGFFGVMTAGIGLIGWCIAMKIMKRPLSLMRTASEKLLGQVVKAEEKVQEKRPSVSGG